MDDEPPGEEEGGAGWIMTFADLMSLLMCFFVLLLSFSEMDVLKFKQLAGSMNEAFGVQREIKVKDIPKGTSIVAQEFSPGKPSPTAIADLRQFTTEEQKENLDFSDGEGKEGEEDLDNLKEALKEQLEQRLQELLAAMEEILDEEIQEGMVELSAENSEVVIRIREKGAFPSGNAQLQKTFSPILDKIGKALNGVDGRVVVSGHSDNIPIYTSKYPSNWVLSAARASNVVHYLTKYARVSSERLEIRAHADTKPIDKNETPEGRAKNRRIEISIRFESFDAINAEDLKTTLDTANINE